MRSLVMAVLLCSVASAQVTFPNSGCGGRAFATTVGPAISLDTGLSTVRVGVGSAFRSAGAANASYLPTGLALDPTTNGSAIGANTGFSIEFWYRPQAATAFHYLFGDALWVGPTGAFRCFANGAAGAGQLLLRGPTAMEVPTTGGPLSAAVLNMSGGWVHLALVVDTTGGTVTWFVNGVMDNQVSTTLTGTGTDFTAIGYNGSSSAGPAGWTDDLRIYDYPRSAVDIAADFNGSVGSCAAPVLSASGDLATPADYFPLDGTQNPHVLVAGINSEASRLETRLIAPGTTLRFGGSTTAAGAFPATGIVNLVGPLFTGDAPTPRTAAYGPAPSFAVPFTTLGVPGLQLGSGLSAPANPLAIAYPDGLGLAAFPGLFGASIPLPYAYGAPDPTFTVPPGVFSDGDRIDIQMLAIDGGWPSALATSNRVSFVYVTPQAGPHCHVEARGVSQIQNTGFWEIWNTGTEAITQVVWDLSTVTGVGGTSFEVTGALNSGGTLATNDSYRFGTDQHVGLVMNGGVGYTGLNPGTAAGTFGALQFDFTSFSPTVNHFVFDCDTPALGAGVDYVGATVTVTFASGATLMGTLTADPADPTEGAILDL